MVATSAEGIPIANLPAADTVGSLSLPMISPIVWSRLFIIVCHPVWIPDGSMRKIPLRLSPIVSIPDSRSWYISGISCVRIAISRANVLTDR